MTLKEKIGQMNQYNGFWNVTGPVPEGGDAQVKYNHLAEGYVGSMLKCKRSKRSSRSTKSSGREVDA